MSLYKTGMSAILGGMCILIITGVTSYLVYNMIQTNQVLAAYENATNATIANTRNSLGTTESALTTLTGAHKTLSTSHTALQQTMQTAQGDIVSLGTKLNAAVAKIPPDFSNGGTLNGNVVVGGILRAAGQASFSNGASLADKTYLYLRGPGASNDGLGYSADVDGPSLMGNTGGKLGSKAATAMSWDSNGNTFHSGGTLKMSHNWTGYTSTSPNNSEIANDTGSFKQLMIVGNQSSVGGVRQVGVWDSLNVHGSLNVTGATTLSNTPLYLRGQSDSNHGLQYDSLINGPNLFGYSGGKLSTSSSNVALRWDANGNLFSGGTFTTSNLCIGTSCISQSQLRNIISKTAS